MLPMNQRRTPLARSSEPPSWGNREVWRCTGLPGTVEEENLVVQHPWDYWV